jgi:hypothetical protein
MTAEEGIVEEVVRIRRVADSLCTAHAGLRDRLSRWALCLDVLILAVSTWLVGLAFVEPQLNLKLTPPGMDDRIWLGVLSVATFFLSILQLKTGWKGRAEAHDRTMSAYAAVKREAGYVLAGKEVDLGALRRVIDRYDMASSICIPVPEREFLRQKRRHVLKIAISRHLDSHPSASLLLTRLKFWWHDNVRGTAGA